MDTVVADMTTPQYSDALHAAGARHDLSIGLDLQTYFWRDEFVWNVSRPDGTLLAYVRVAEDGRLKWARPTPREVAESWSDAPRPGEVRVEVHEGPRVTSLEPDQFAAVIANALR
jgi:hypothetical protein